MNNQYLKHCKGRSEVIPNQALSLRDIMIRSLRGQYLAEVAANQLQFGEDESESDDLPEFEDKFDMLDHASYLEQRVNEFKAAKEAEKAAKAQQAEQSVAQQAKAPETAENPA